METQTGAASQHLALHMCQVPCKVPVASELASQAALVIIPAAGLRRCLWLFCIFSPPRSRCFPFYRDRESSPLKVFEYNRRSRRPDRARCWKAEQPRGSASAKFRALLKLCGSCSQHVHVQVVAPAKLGSVERNTVLTKSHCRQPDNRASPARPCYRLSTLAAVRSS